MFEDLFLWLFGIRDAAGAKNWGIDWIQPIAPWFLFMIVVPAFAFLAWSLYKRETGFLTRARRGTLMALRLGAFGVLVLILMQPVVSMDLETSVKGVVVVLIDDSLSFGLKDDQYNSQELAGLSEVCGIDRGEVKSKTRLELAQAWLRNPKLRALDAIKAKSDVKIYTYSSELKETGAIDKIEPRGTSTRLGDAILQALREVRGKHVNSILVIGDGRSNAGLTVKYVADSVGNRRPPIAIYAVGVGSDKPPRDLKLLRASAEPVVQKDDEIVFEFEIDHTGFERQQPVAVQLVGEGGRVLTRKEVPLGESGHPVKDRLVTRADKEGEIPFTVEVVPLQGEISEDNNRQSQSVLVLDKRIKVLFVEGIARSEYLFLRASLIRDPKLHTYCWLASADPAWPQELSLELLRKGDRGLQTFPGEIKDLKEFDVVILGDVNLRTLGQPRRATDPSIDWRKLGDNLVRFVEEFGGAVVFLAGHEHDPWGYRDTPLEKLLPVKIPSVNPLPGRIFNEPFHPRVTAHGRGDPILRLRPEEEQNVKFWEQPGGLPPLYWYAPVRETKPTARTLLTHPNGSILAASMQVGRGRTLYLGTDEIWRWREFTRDATYYKFWGTAIQRMRMGRLARDKRYNLFVKPVHTLGEKVEIEAQVFDENLQPSRLEEIEAKVEAPGGAQPEKVKLKAVEGRPGIFSGVCEPKRDGSYRIWLGSDERVEDRTLETFLVRTPVLEFEAISMDPAPLRDLADKTGGRYVPLHEAAGLVDDIKKGTALPPLRERKERDLWDTPLAFLLFFVFIVVEWALRKRWGLA
jgi:hypothetical protein